MGWWGTDILEGDTPLDCLGDIVDFLVGAEVIAKDDSSKALKDESAVLAVYRAIKEGQLCEYSPEIAQQVLVDTIITVGGALPESVAQAVLAVNQLEISKIDQYGWDEPNERIADLNAFGVRIQLYDGVAVDRTSYGLFDVIAESIGNHW